MVEEQKMSVDEFKLNYPKLSEVLSEWCGTEENENLAICHAFTLYEYKKNITSGNAAYEIDNMNREFDYIEHKVSHAMSNDELDHIFDTDGFIAQ